MSGIKRMDLPEGWKSLKLRDITDRITKGSTPTSYGYVYQSEGIQFIKAENIDENGFITSIKDFIDEDANEFLNRSILNENDVLFSIAGTIGRVGIVRRVDLPANTNQALAIIRTLPGSIDTKYLCYYLKSDDVQKFVSKLTVGVGRANLSLTNVNEIEVPLAPFNQQKLIVAEIEKQFSRLDEAVAALKRIQANLKRYKASVLKAAVEGKLTEEWRKKNINVEPASELLKRILYERKKKWETEHPGKKYKEPATLDPSNLPELPTGWVWATPEMLAQHEENSICAGPFGTIFKAKDFREEGIPIIFLRHLAPGRYLTHKPGFMDKSKWKELFQTYSVYGGELLVTKLGEPPGICAIYPENIGPAMVTPDVMKMSVNRNAAHSKYLMYYFNSQIAMSASSELSFGTTRLRLTLPIFRNLPIPVPPLTEQFRIVAEIESRLSVTEEGEATIEMNLKRAERLRQSILKKAFSGGLIPNSVLKT